MLLCSCLALSAAYLFGDLSKHDWAFDDEDYIANAVKAQENFTYVFSADKPWAQRPVVHIYFWLVQPYFESDPGLYHLTNVCIHVVNAILLSVAMHLLLQNFAIASIAGILFLINVNQLRAVFWISGVPYLIGATLGLLSIITLINYLQNKTRFSAVASVLLFIGSIHAHEGAASFIAIIFSIVYRSQTERLRILAPCSLGLFLLLIESRYYYSTPLSDGQVDYHIGWNIAETLPRQIFTLFSSSHYDSWLIIPDVSWQIGLGLLFLALLAAVGLRKPHLRHTWLWTVIFLLPYTPFTNAEEISRYYYLPSLISTGIITLAIKKIGDTLSEKVGIRWLGGSWLASTTGAIFVLSASQVDCRQAVQLSYSALYLQQHGKFQRALIQYDSIENLCSESPYTPRWQYNAALCAANIGQNDKAVQQLMQLVQHFPNYSSPYPVLLELICRKKGVNLHLDTAGRPVNEQNVKQAIKDAARTAVADGRKQDVQTLARLYGHFFELPKADNTH